jgi:hypothetical protein
VLKSRALCREQAQRAQDDMQHLREETRQAEMGLRDRVRALEDALRAAEAHTAETAAETEFAISKRVDAARQARRRLRCCPG